MSISSRPVAAAILFAILILLPARPAAADTLTIEMAVSLGLERHPELRMARGEIDAARGQFWEAVGPEPPVVSVEHEEIPTGSGLYDYGQRNVGITQSLEFPLVTYFRGRSSSAAVESARSSFDIARVSARSEIRLTFVRAWLQQRKLAVADSLAGTAARLLAIAERKLAVGEITGLERDRLLVQSANFLKDKREADLDYRIALSALEQLIGAGLAEPVILIEPGPLGATNDTAANESNSAFMRRARLVEKSKRGLLTAEKLSWLPNFEMRIFRQSISGERYWGGELGLSIPIWFPLGGRGRVLGARGEAEQASAQLEQARREWNASWTEAIGSYHLALDALKAFEDVTLPVSRRAFGAAVRSYEVGELGLTDLLSSILQEKTIEIDYLEAIENAWYWKGQIDILAAQSGR